MVLLRDARPGDAAAVNAVALAAFAQYADEYEDWDSYKLNIGRMAELAGTGELIVAEAGREVVGAVIYVGPEQPKRDFFEPGWPVLRMLVVSPSHRGLGIGRLLTEECIQRARRDKAPLIALHTSPIMQVALPMYLRLGFLLHKHVPDIAGVPYAVYTKELA